MTTDGVRDLVGYGSHPPAITWPGGARLAVNLVVNYEHPGRLHGLRRFLDHIQGHPDIWICRRRDIAACWRAQVPPPPPA